MRCLLLMIALSPIIAVSRQQNEVHVSRAYTETNDGGVCFDLPEGLVDWNQYAERILGERTFKNPDPNTLRKNFFEAGGVSRLTFEAAAPTSVSKIKWFLLHENGCDQVQPAILRGEVTYDVNRNFRVIRRRPASGMACVKRVNNSIRAAFALRGTGPAVWSSHRAALQTDKADHFVLSSFGRVFTFTKPESAVPRIKDVLLFKISEQKSIILVVWDSDPKCESACCEFAYTLYEIGSDQPLRLIAQNFYRCDV